MKKSLILLALPALLLSGCSKEISKEDAKKRAQEIADHEVKLDDFKKVHIEDTDDGSFEGNVNGTAKSKHVLEYSTEDKWVHSVTESEEKQGEETVTYKSEDWVYQDDGKYYVVEYLNNNGTEHKGYSVYQESDPLWAVEKPIFEAAFSAIQTSAFAGLTGKESLKMLISKIDGGSLDGVTFDLKYFSTGEGNLTVEGKTVNTDFELYGYKGEVTATVKMGWDKYVLAENTAEYEGTLKNEEGKEVKYKNSNKTTYSYDVTVGKPNLDEYTPAN